MSYREISVILDSVGDLSGDKVRGYINIPKTPHMLFILITVPACSQKTANYGLVSSVKMSPILDRPLKHKDTKKREGNSGYTGCFSLVVVFY